MGTRVIAVVGATATGKSGLATELALALGGEVVNADSMQLYQGMDIGTAKEPEAARRGVPHHLLDIWPVTQTANVADYAKLARAAIDEIIARGRVPVLAGGSGLYVRAALDDLDFPGTDEAIRASLEEELARVGAAALHTRLARLDPVAAAAILPGNGRRIVRALEVIEISGRPFAATMPAFAENRPAVQIGLTLPRPELDQRIAARVDRMWQAGLEAEVRSLAAQGLRDGKTASRALGYQQLLRYLDGEWTLDEARLETMKATRRFARRQESWFRRDPRVRWLDASPPADALLTAALGSSARPRRYGGGPGPSAPGQGVGHEQPRQQVRLHGQRPERQGDGDVVVGPVHDLDLVAGPDLARLDHPEVGPGPGGQREPLDPAALRQPPWKVPHGIRGADASRIRSARSAMLADQRAPSTGRLSMPVSFIVFHGFGRGWPTLTDRSLMSPLHLIAEPVGTRGVVGTEHPGQPRRGPFGEQILLQAGAQERGQGGPEQRRAQVVQLGQAERVRGVQELPERRQLQGLGQQRRGARAQVVRCQPGVDVDVREHLGQVARPRGGTGSCAAASPAPRWARWPAAAG